MQLQVSNLRNMELDHVARFIDDLFPGEIFQALDACARDFAGQVE
jgi:hypothetical protein